MIFKWFRFEIFRAIFLVQALKILGFYLNIFYKIWFIGIFLIFFFFILSCRGSQVFINESSITYLQPCFGAQMHANGQGYIVIMQKHVRAVTCLGNDRTVGWGIGAQIKYQNNQAHANRHARRPAIQGKRIKFAVW